MCYRSFISRPASRSCSDPAAEDPCMDETTKEQVRQRADGCCEYCHLPEVHVLTPFQIEHVIARQHRGRDALTNLAWACLRCNLHKGTNLTGIDPKTNRL